MTSTTTSAPATKRSFTTVTLWARPFRPFFIGAAVAGGAAVPVWLAVLFGLIHPPLALPPLSWHAHEMFFGFLSAALAGFLLTAVCHWTGSRPVAGIPLIALFSLWVAGRLLLFSGGGLPHGLALAVDLAFLPAVGLAAGRRIAAARNWGNLTVLAVIAFLWTADILFHVSGGGLPAGALRLAADAATLLMLLMGGRITPAFTRNWLAIHRPGVAGPGVFPWLDRLTLGGVALLGLMDLLGLEGASLVAVTAAALSSVRLVAWRGWRTTREPLLWVLHLGMAWVSLALWLRGLSGWLGLAPTVWLHALGAGAMGTLILGVMTRVALGHTGREIRLPRGASAVYLAVIIAGVLRVGVAAGLLQSGTGLLLAAVCWTLAFVLFLCYFGPILTRARVDGRPG